MRQRRKGGTTYEQDEGVECNSVFDHFTSSTVAGPDHKDLPS